MLLTERQRTTAAAAVTLLSAVFIILVVLGLCVLLGRFLSAFSNVIVPLVAAAVLALILRPYYTWLRTRLRLAPILAVVVIYISVILPLGGFLWFFGSLLVDQLQGLLAKLPGWWLATKQWLSARMPALLTLWEEYGMRERVRGGVAEHGDLLVAGLQRIGQTALDAGAGFFGFAAGLLGWVVLPVYLFFLLAAAPMKRGTFESLLPFLKPETRQDVIYLGREFVGILVAFFRGQMLVAFVQGLLFAIGFAAVGLQYGFVLGLLLGFLNIVPYLGNMVGLLIAVPLALFQDGGGWIKLTLVLGVFTLVQCIEGYFLTPKIMGDRTGLHPMVIMVAIFFWGSALGGIPGMILAIPLTAFVVVFWRLLRTKYIREIV